MSGRTRRQWLVRLAALAAGPALAQPRIDAPLLIGVPPFLTPSAMLGSLRPLREHLQQRLQRPVEFYSSKDIGELARLSRRGAYDIALLPAHVAGLALSDWKFQPLAGTVTATRVLVLVRNDPSIRSAADLRGRRVGSLGQFSLSAAFGLLWLRQQKLEPGREVTVLAQTSINSAMISLERGDIDAVFATRSQLDSLPPGQFNAHAVLTELADIPAPIYMAPPGVAADTLQRWRAALHSFTPDPSSPTTTANSRLHALDAAELRRLAALREIAREQFAS